MSERPAWLDAKYNKDGEKTLKTLRIKPDELLRFCKVALTTTEDAEVRMTSAGIESCGVDPSHVSMMKVWTRGYKKQHQAEIFCMEWRLLHEAVGRTDNEVILRYYMKRGEAQSPIPDSENEGLRHGYKKPTFVLEVMVDRGKPHECVTKIICLDRQHIQRPKIPKMTLDSRISVDGFRMKEAVKRLAAVGDLVTLSIGRKSTLSIVGGRVKRSMQLTPLMGKRDTKGKCTTQFSLQYLTSVCSLFGTKTKAAGHATLYSANKYPLKMRSLEDVIEWEFFLAPRVAGDNE